MYNADKFSKTMQHITYIGYINWCNISDPVNSVIREKDYKLAKMGFWETRYLNGIVVKLFFLLKLIK